MEGVGFTAYDRCISLLDCCGGSAYCMILYLKDSYGIFGLLYTYICEWLSTPRRTPSLLWFLFLFRYLLVLYIITSLILRRTLLVTLYTALLMIYTWYYYLCSKYEVH